MTLTNIIVLSIVQGLTEFLPISSSGHLVIIPKLLDFPDQGMTMDMAVNLGTFAAAVIYYFTDLLSIAKSFIFYNKPELQETRKLGLYVAFATIPAVIVGFAMHKYMPEGIRDVRVVACTSIFYGALMIAIDKLCNNDKEISQFTFKSAMLVGFSQILALIPGTSRSGITIVTSRFLGFKHEAAAKFSFLLSIPVTGGAGLVAILDFMKSGNSELGMDILIAIVVSFLAGYGAIAFMMRWLKTLGLVPFGIYRILLGTVLFLFFI